MKTLVSLSLLSIISTVALAGPLDSQHEVAALIETLQRPISAEAIAKARAADDQLILSGEFEGQQTYLVTDDRVAILEGIVNDLLTAMGEDPDRWVVRVLDTDPKIVNAFVTGGKYIYVFTGFLEEAQSKDEIAFVLGHELGHSLLKHKERQANDWTQTVAALAAVAASINGNDSLGALSAVLMSNYSQLDEQEADAIGVAIAERAGYNALRGADFFSRAAKKQDTQEEEWRAYGQKLETTRAQLEQQRVNCQYLMTSWNQIPHNQYNVDLYNKECGTYESKRQSYNQALTQYNATNAQRNIAKLTSSHPDDRSRISAVVALIDFLKGRRDLDSLQAHEQAYRVMKALNAVGSVLSPSIEHASDFSENTTALDLRRQMTETAPAL